MPRPALLDGGDRGGHSVRSARKSCLEVKSVLPARKGKPGKVPGAGERKPGTLTLPVGPLSPWWWQRDCGGPGWVLAV